MSGETKDKHTPGPWFSMSAITDPENVDGLREDDGAILVTQDKADDYESDIAYAIGRHVSAPNRTNEEIEANARLIEAAPDMLDALVACVEDYERGLIEDDAWQMLHIGKVERPPTPYHIMAARAAIAKARGEG